MAAKINTVKLQYVAMLYYEQERYKHPNKRV